VEENAFDTELNMLILHLVPVVFLLYFFVFKLFCLSNNQFKVFIKSIKIRRSNVPIMDIYILGGFLGSGKTSLVTKLADNYSKQGKKIAIIINEAGEAGVDGDALKAQGYSAMELENGCICCTLAGTLQSALKGIVKDIKPDIILIEPTGLALPNKVKELVHFACLGEDKNMIVGIADITRFEILITRKLNFFTGQMRGASFVIINKADLAKEGEIEKAMDWYNKELPGKAVIPVSMKTGENLDIVLSLMSM